MSDRIKKSNVGISRLTDWKNWPLSLESVQCSGMKIEKNIVISTKMMYTTIYALWANITEDTESDFIEIVKLCEKIPIVYKD